MPAYRVFEIKKDGDDVFVEEGQIYYGKRGGKYADPEHKIPFKQHLKKRKKREGELTDKLTQDTKGYSYKQHENEFRYYFDLNQRLLKTDPAYEKSNRRQENLARQGFHYKEMLRKRPKDK